MSQQPTPGTTDKDEQEIRELIARPADSWACGDAQAYGAEFTDDCDTSPSTASDTAVPANPRSTWSGCSTPC